MACIGNEQNCLFQPISSVKSLVNVTYRFMLPTVGVIYLANKTAGYGIKRTRGPQTSLKHYDPDMNIYRVFWMGRFFTLIY